MVRLIHSLSGRARFKVKGLYRSEPLKRHIESRLSKKEGISLVSVNIFTGNVLITFNSNNTHSSIESYLKEIVLSHKVDSDIPKEAPVKIERQIKSRRRLRRLVSMSEEQPFLDWHTMDANAAISLLESDRNRGISVESAKERLKRFGPNVLPEAVPRSGLSILIEQFKSLPVALLGVAAGVSALTGGIADALVIMGVICINAAIGYVTESKAEKTLHSLKSLVRPSANVIRDGRVFEIGAEEIVPGDILVLRPGTYIAADARLITANYLSVDESALTGESMPVLKNTEALKYGDAENENSDNEASGPPNFKTNEIPLADRTNMVYMGTLVTGGQGLAVVVATGRFTEIGKIQSLVGEASPPETPMERQLNVMGNQLVLIGGVVCGVVFIIGLLRGYGFLQMLKTSISLAVAAVPEGLPTVATTTLALGIRKMRRHNVLIRHLDAVETLGSVQTICLDKTGTITMNKMSVVEVFTGMRRLKLVNGGFLIDDEHADTSHLPPSFKDWKQSFLDKDSCVSPYYCDELLRLIHISVLCNESTIDKAGDRYIVNGSPTENALIHTAIESGIDVEMLRSKFPMLDIKHRSEKRNFMLTIHGIKIQGSENHHGKIIAVKGSPNEVLSMCLWQMKDGKKIELTEDSRLNIEIENERMAGKALRVLGVAYAFIDEGTMNVKDEKSETQEDVYSSSCEPLGFLTSGLVWLGLVGMEDPVREGVKELIGKFHLAGIDTVMITGDQSPTAYAIGKELNLSKGEQLEILDSTHLSNIEPEVMKALCERVHVFARVSPAHKLQIVQSLQMAGKITAMTGDGINDGPALKAADIGIAMGHTGTDVAREVADVVLEDDNLETMIIAISQGRTIYNNIRKSVHFLLATNMSEILLMFIAIAGGMGHPLNAMQLLWINLLSDIAPGLALALEPPEPDVLSRPPRNPEEPIIRQSDFRRLAFESAALSAGALGAYGYGLMRYGMGARANTLSFMSLTMGQLLHAISCRSEKHSIFDKGKLPPNKYLNIALAGSFILQAIAMIVSGFRSLLGIAPINIIDGIVIGGGAVVPLLVNEGTKGNRQ